MCMCSSGGLPKTANTEEDPLIPTSEIADESDPTTVRCVAYAAHRTGAENTEDTTYEIVR